MKTRIHRDLAERIREGCEDRLNVRVHPRWFAVGNVCPDCTHQRVLHMHRLDAAELPMGRRDSPFPSKTGEAVEASPVLCCHTVVFARLITGMPFRRA